MKRILALALTALTLGACAALEHDDGRTFWGDDVAAVGVWVDLANTAGVLILEAGNVSPEDAALIVNASQRGSDLLAAFNDLNIRYETDGDITYAINDAFAASVRSLTAFVSLLDVEGSPLSGVHWSTIATSLFAGTFPEMHDLNALIREAGEEGRVLTQVEIQVFVDNAFGSTALVVAAGASYEQGP
ncbi:MAG: hypothetical protein AAFX39_12615 [Pseudomonadota bacterium]